MNESATQMSAELAAELSSNERRTVDPRTMPARFHNLLATAISPAHGFASFQDSGRRESLAMRVGSGLHAMMFDLPRVMWTGKVRNGKVWDAFKAEHSAEVILNRKEWARAEKIAASIRRHPIAERLLMGPGTIREKTIYWTQLGRARRTTPDVRGPFHVCELKSARCTEPGKFVRDAGFRSYHVQIAEQGLAIEAETGHKPTESYIVAVESVEPFAVTVFQVSDASIRKGERLAQLWLERLMACEAANHWPAYSDGIELLDVPDDSLDVFESVELPEWATKEDEP